MTVELWMTKQFTAQRAQRRLARRALARHARAREGRRRSSTPRAPKSSASPSAMEQQFPEVFRERRAHLSERSGIHRRRHAEAAVHHSRRGGARAAHRVRERRQPDARARDGARRRDGGAHRARRRTRPTRAAADHRERAPLAAAAPSPDSAWRRSACTSCSARAPQSRSCSSDGASIDATTLVVTAGIALLTGLVFGILPAMQVTQGDLATALRAGARGYAHASHGTSRQAADRRRRSRARRHAAHRRRSAASQFRESDVRRSRLPSGRRAVDESRAAVRARTTARRTQHR